MQRKPKTTKTHAPADPKTAALTAAIDAARRRLLLDTLETRGSDSRDFHDLSVSLIREALTGMFEAGFAAARSSPTPTPANSSATKPPIASRAGITITDITPRRGPGKWAQGTVAGHTFEALVFVEHAEHASFELHRSRISKLSVRDAAGREVVNFDRGWDVTPMTEEAQRVTDLLVAELAALVYRK